MPGFHKAAHDQGMEQGMMGAVACAAYHLVNLPDGVPAQIARIGQHQDRQIHAQENEKRFQKSVIAEKVSAVALESMGIQRLSRQPDQSVEQGGVACKRQGRL